MLIALLTATLLMQVPARPAQPDYVVGVQDVLNIVVFGEADLTKVVTVDADGTFDFPLVGRVKASGLTVRAIKEALERKLESGFLVSPQVSVDVAKYRSQNVIVLGNVRIPGQYPLTGNMSVLEVLAAAGSPTPAAANHVIITRPPGDGPRLPHPVAGGGSTLRISMKDLLVGQVPAGFALRDGDTINVPQAETISVTGFVKSPGPYVIEGEVTVMQAIALAGGVTERGSTGRVKIFRRVNDRLVEIKNVKLSDLVKPGDTIEVPQRFF
jgi:polysaccharide export outer membrane protein